MTPDLPEGYEITTDPARVDVGFVHAYLSEQSYWAKGVPREVVTRAIANSLCFCVFGPDGQAGFARVITDRATFAYLCDMFVAPPYIGQGLGKALVATIIAHPDLQGLRRRLLGTHDAHTLYARYGFVPLARPQNFMEIRDPDVYRQAPETE